MSGKTAEQIAKQIEDSFDDIGYPGDNNLVGKIEHADTLRLFLDFKGKHWRQITPEVLLRHRFGLLRFTPQAFRFYLPAYILFSLLGEEGGEIIQHVIWSFDPEQGNGDATMEIRNKVETLSPRQKSAVKDFVKYYMETETYQVSADKRVEAFWDNYSI